MINNLKNKLEKFSISSSALLGLMFLSLACTETRVIEKPGETVYVEVPGETETVYVYVDQGVDTIDQATDQFVQDMDLVLNPDNHDAELIPEQDAQVTDMAVFNETDAEELPELDQNMQDEILDMDPVEEIDADLPEPDQGVIFEPSDTLESLEVHPCPIDNSRLEASQLLRSYEETYDPRALVNYDEPPSDEPFILPTHIKNYWNTSFSDFEQYQEIGCFEYKNTGEEIIVLDRLAFDFWRSNFQLDFKLEFSGVDLPDVEVDGYRGQVEILPESNIPILAGQDIQVKVSAFLSNNDNLVDFFSVSSVDPYMSESNIYILNYLERIKVFTYGETFSDSFYLGENQIEFADENSQDLNQQIVNQVSIFEGSFRTIQNTYLGQTIDAEVVCNNTGGNYEVEIKVNNSLYDSEENQNNQVSVYQIQNGENRIPFQIQPMLVDSYTGFYIRVNGENVVQSPENGDTIQCHFERSSFPQELEIYNRYDEWNQENLFGSHITWVESAEMVEPEESIKVYFQGYSGRDRGPVEIFENNPNFDDYLVRFELEGFGNYQNIDFNINLTNNDGIFARARIVTWEGEELFNEQIVIPRGQSQHSLDLNIDNQDYYQLFFEIVPIDDEQLRLPSSFNQFPPQIQFDLRDIQVLNEDQELINIDTDLWDEPRPMPFEENAVRYYFNTPDMYLIQSSQRNEIIDIAPDGTIGEFERVELANIQMSNNSSISKCYTKLVFGKRDKEIELFNQIWVNDVLVIAENINRNNFYVDLSNQDRCSLRSGGYVNEFYRPSGNFWLNVEFAGTFNPETVETSDTIQISLLYVEGYFTRHTDEGELRVPFQTFFRDENENWSPLQLNVFGADGSIDPELVNRIVNGNMPEGLRGNRVTFIRHQ
ncbi:hypothetical protein CL656_00645 [bacterium]|nr:hypothetical protein [bacterium]